MGWWFIVAGFFILLLTIIDIYTTALARGRGILSDRINAFLNIYLMKLHKVNKRKQPHIIQGGIMALLVALTTWFMLLWAGWCFVFCGNPFAVVNANTHFPASVTERIYYTGYTLFTLGLGDFKPYTGFHQICTPLTTLSGLFFVTFSITYIVPVLQAGIALRSLSNHLSGLGSNSLQIVTTAAKKQNMQIF